MNDQDRRTHFMISAIWPWELVPPGGHGTFFSGDVKGLYTNTRNNQTTNTTNANGIISIVLGD